MGSLLKYINNKFSIFTITFFTVSIGILSYYFISTRRDSKKNDNIISMLNEIAIVAPYHIDKKYYYSVPITIQRSIEEASEDIENIKFKDELVHYDFEILEDILKNQYDYVPNDLIVGINKFFERFRGYRKERDKFAYQDLYNNSLTTEEMHSEAMKLNRGGEVWLKIWQYRMQNKVELLGLLQEKINLEQKLFEIMPRDYTVVPKE